MKKIIAVILLCLFFTFVGCASQENAGDGYAEGNESSSVVVETNRKIYYTVNLSVETDDLTETANKYSSLVTKLGGYMSSSEIRNDQYGTIIYKVPTEKLNEFLDFLQTKDAANVIEKNIKSTDITTSYNKVASRLEVLTASREAYVNALKNAQSTSEIISINSRIEEIDSEILNLEYEKSSYDSLLEYSTITVNFNSVEKESFFKDYFEYLGNFFVGLGKMVLYLLPIGFVGFGVVYCIIIIDKMKKKKKEKQNQIKIE